MKYSNRFIKLKLSGFNAYPPIFTIVFRLAFFLLEQPINFSLELLQISRLNLSSTKRALILFFQPSFDAVGVEIMFDVT